MGVSTSLFGGFTLRQEVVQIKRRDFEVTCNTLSPEVVQLLSRDFEETCITLPPGGSDAVAAGEGSFAMSPDDF